VKVTALRPEYVEHLPEQLEQGVLYICEEFDVTAHKCCCGCGEDVYNKLGPARWRMIKMPDATVTLHPSIGNWNYKCQSHYWIQSNRVIDAGWMSARAIKAAQRRDRHERGRYLAGLNAGAKDGASWWERATALVAGTVRAVKALWR
jgi:Family of unknown function (DUF6527)